MSTSTDPLAGLTDDERLAVDVAHDVYMAVRHAPVMDSTDHWERFANRIASAAFAATAPRFVQQCARRFGVAHIHGTAVSRLLSLTPMEARRVLRVLRGESAAVSVLVRDRRDQSRRKTGQKAAAKENLL